MKMKQEGEKKNKTEEKKWKKKLVDRQGLGLFNNIGEIGGRWCMVDIHDHGTDFVCLPRSICICF